MNRHTIGINIMFIETASSPYEKAKIRAEKETIREERRKEKKRKEKKILIDAVYTIDIGVTTQFMQLLKYEMNHLFHVKHIW